VRVGVLVDGQAEFYSFPRIIPRLPTQAIILSPLYLDLQPWAPPAQVMRVVSTRLAQLRRRNVDRVVVLLDHEQRTDCPGQRANAIKISLDQHLLGSPQLEFAVVVKNRMFENWLIADPDAFLQIPARFQLSANDIALVRPDRADRADAARILGRAALGKSYSKVQDAGRILEHADPRRMGTNSRSFRRFLRLVGDARYANQSARP
jgi:hypothetical protein